MELNINKIYFYYNIKINNNNNEIKMDKLQKKDYN